MILESVPLLVFRECGRGEGRNPRSFAQQKGFFLLKYLTLFSQLIFRFHPKFGKLLMVPNILIDLMANQGWLKEMGLNWNVME